MKFKEIHKIWARRTVFCFLMLFCELLYPFVRNKELALGSFTEVRFLFSSMGQRSIQAKQLIPFFTYFWGPVLQRFVNKRILEVDKVEKVLKFSKKLPSKHVAIEDGWQ